MHYCDKPYFSMSRSCSCTLNPDKPIILLTQKNILRIIMRNKVFQILSFCCIFANSVLCAFEKPDHWVDPGDMLTFDHVTKTNRRSEETTKYIEKTEKFGLELANNVQSASTELENSEKAFAEQNCPKVECPNVSSLQPMEQCGERHEDSMFMRRFVAFLLEKLSVVGKPADVTDYQLMVRLHRHDWTFLEEFHTHPDKVAIQDVLQKVEGSFQEFDFYRENHNNNWFWKFEHYFHVTVDDAIKCGMVILLVVTILTLEYFSRISWSTQFKRFCILMLLISYVWTYIHQYQIAVAKRNAAVSKTVPEYCVNGEKQMTYFETITTTLWSTISTTDDPCTQHHKDFVESPFLTVTPTKVLAVTVSEFFLEPLSHFGTAFSKTFRNMFSQLPPLLWIPAFVFIIIVALGVLLMLTVCLGYSWNLRLPFWSGLEIAPPTHALNTRHHEEMVGSLRQQIEQQRQIINTLQNHQRPAIDYPRNDDSWGTSIRRFLGYHDDDQPRPPPANQGQTPAGQGESFANNPSTTDIPLHPPTNGCGEGLRRRQTHPYPTQLPYPPEPQYSPISPPVLNVPQGPPFCQNSPQYEARMSDEDLFVDTTESRSSASPGSRIRSDSSSVLPDPEGEPPPYEEATASSPQTREIGFTRHVLEGAVLSNDTREISNTNLPPINEEASSSRSSESDVKDPGAAKPVETISHEHS